MSAAAAPSKTPDQFDLLDPQTLDDPYSWYASLREHAPVYEVPGTGVYLVSKRALIDEVLERQDDFSANLSGVLMTGASGEPALFDLTQFATPVNALATADEPAHAVHRKLVLPEVTPKRIAAMEPTLRRWAAETIGPLVAEGGGDFAARVANPIPIRATALLVGLPIEDEHRLLEWAVIGSEIMAGPTTLERMAYVGQRTGEMAAYLAQHLQRALAAPAAPGVIGEVARGIRAGLLCERDGLANLVVLTSAGGESTSSLTGSAARILAEQPELQERLRADPERIPSFVEETVRLESSFRGHYRAAKRATRLGGVDLPEGSRVLLLWGAANRDPELFEDPDAVDLERRNLQEHMGFGRGIHFCVGARLAKMEARVILEELLARTHSFSLHPDKPPRYVRSLQVRRHSELELLTRAPA